MRIQPGDVLPDLPPDPTREVRAKAAWDLMAKDPEHESFGGPTWDEMDPHVRRFALLAFALVDKQALSDTPPAPIRCWECRDTGFTNAVHKTDSVVWFCMACEHGLRSCAAYWVERLKRAEGQRDFAEWKRLNATDVPRVAQYMTAAE